jgi:hypothetical protein
MFDLETVIGILSSLSVLAPIAIYVLRFRSLPKQNHIIGILAGISFLFDLVGYIRRVNKQSNVMLFNAYYLIQHLLLTVFFYEILFKRSKQFFFKAGIAAFIGSYMVISFVAQGFTEYQGYAWTASSLILAAYGLIFKAVNCEPHPFPTGIFKVHYLSTERLLYTLALVF